VFDVVAAGAVILSLLAPLPATPAGPAARRPPTPDQVVIKKLKVNGSGCRPDTAAIGVSADSLAFTVTYSEYLAEAGGGAKPRKARRDCHLHLKIDVPKGYSYAITQADYRGFAHLERGAGATESAAYYFQGQPEAPPVVHPLTSPYDDDWQQTDHTELVWGPCGKSRQLHIDTELLVDAGTNPDKTSFVAMDSLDTSLNQTYHVVWRDCKD
jgi:hypothetical protein